MFNKRKNKTFNYNSRFSKDEKNGEDVNEKTNIEWKHARKTGTGKRKIGLQGLLLLLGIIIAVWYYLEYKL